MNKIKNINRLFLGMVIFAFLFSYGIGFFVTGLGTEMAMILGQLMYLIPILFYIVVMRVPVKEEIPFRKIKWSTACMVVLFVILLMPLVSFLNLFSMLFVTNHVNASAQELNTNPFLVNLLLVGVMPAVSEEFMFRGVFYGSYRRKNHVQGAVMCGLIFGMAHLNVNQFLYAFVAGFAFCLLMEATGSILAPMLAHFIIDAWSVVVLELQKVLVQAVPQVSDTIQSGSLSSDYIITALQGVAVAAVICTALAGCVLVWISKHCNRDIHFISIFRNAFKRREPEMSCITVNGELQAAEQDDNRRLITPCFVIGALICIVQMIIIG
ncbi:CPBP family intramembrane glutamic endopeptidase [Robinsoniella peoriensis]|uniref:CAAX amino terminal protease self-immunity n=1 Tax=Robinsoniella peoriensis TaxID=180332 RepID=A0A4U8QA64_9FIRM|nr:type II CAAX endopeptidase family protein [Robinsoniella peoriensis]MDU7026484.1 type II CAAX endopeptidase family protein [Clostridiales bacterium]TLD01113.1 CAAX amino terminal protease self- immunity [Robinsoniella peoriensis]